MAELVAATKGASVVGRPITPGDDFCIPKPRCWGCWHLVQRRYLVHCTGGRRTSFDYEIDLWGIDTHKELTDWLFHVGGKALDTADFFLAMRAIFRSAGWTDRFSGKDLATAYWRATTQPPA